MTRILITGVSGLLGLNAALQCRQRFEVTGCFFTHPVALDGVRTVGLNAAEPKLMSSFVRQLRPDVILHAAGLASVDACEADADLAYRLNVEFTRQISENARDLGSSLIHISTDHLFSGTESLVSETALPNPLNTYARTKLEAELCVQKICPKALIIRTNFFGWGTSLRTSFTDWILRSLARQESLNMFVDVFFTPILVNDLIELVLELHKSQVSGVLNVVGRERLTKYEFGRRVAQAFGYPMALILPCSVEDIALRAPRPRDMSLSSAKVAALLGRPMPSVAEGLAGLRRRLAEDWPVHLQRAVQASANQPLPELR